MPEDWQSAPYQSFMRCLVQSDPESDTLSALTLAFSELPEVLTAELRFQSWLMVLARMHQFMEVSTSSERHSDQQHLRPLSPASDVVHFEARAL